MTLTWGDGTSYPFVQTSPGIYSPPVGVSDSLVRNADGTFTLTTPKQLRYHFNSSLVCDWIKDLNDNTITIHYTGSNADLITDPSGRTITLAYASGTISQITDPLSRVWQLAYTGGNLTSITRPLLAGKAYSTTLAYGARNNITSLRAPSGAAWSYSYAANSDTLVSEQDPVGNRTSYAYSSGSVSVTDANGNVSRTFFDQQGRVIQVQDALNNVESYEWDANNHRTKLTDKRGHIWLFGPDAQGNNLWYEDPYQHRTTQTWTALNRLGSVTHPTGDSQVFPYDQRGNLTAMTSYDANGVQQAVNTAAYDANGLQIDTHDANGRHTHFGYNTHGQLVSMTTPAGRTRGWEPDLLGEIQASTDGMGRRTQFVLDEWGRVLTVVYPDSSRKTSTHDLDGGVTQVCTAASTTQFTYDSGGRVTGQVTNGIANLSYSYDALGKLGLLSSKTDHVSGRTWTYSYTARNELSQVTESGLGAASYAYDENGNTTREQHLDGGVIVSECCEHHFR